jgi:xanthosine utilization system XapX-like protein
MSQTTERLRDCLLAEEPLQGVYAATLSDDSAPKEVSVGVTDRRLLCLADDGTFLDVGYDAICAIRSRPESTFTYRGNDYRLLLGGGAGLSVIGFFALVAFSSNPAVPVLALATVGALVATVLLVWNDRVAELVTLDALDERTAADFDGVDALRRVERALPARADGHRLLLSVSALVTVVCFAGTVALTANSLVLLSFLPMLTGIGLVEYARRNADELDGIEIRRERARNVRISTADGRTVTLAVDPSAEIDRELGRLTAVAARDGAVQPISARA